MIDKCIHRYKTTYSLGPVFEYSKIEPIAFGSSTPEIYLFILLLLQNIFYI